MKCEICHIQEAQEAIHKVVNGEEQELYVCHDCARRAREAEKPAPAAAPSNAVPSASVPAGPTIQASISLPPGLQNKAFAGDLASLICMMLQATFEIIGRKAAPSELTCPCCGMTRAEFRKNDRVGCMMCYELFKDDVDRALVDMQQGTRHVGKAPKNAPKSEELSSLFDQLRQALATHNASALAEAAKRIQASGCFPSFGGNQEEPQA